MKQINIYAIVALFTLFSFSSCDLDTSPSDKVDEELILSDAEHLDKLVTGAWVSAMETSRTYANPGYGAMLRAGDAMGSDIVLNTKYGFSSHYSFSAMYTTDRTGYTTTLSWSMLYSVVNNMNIVLKNIDTANGDDKTKDRIKAQAYALRGFAYLHLASYYSFAIDKDPDAVCGPIYTETDFGKAKPASSISEVYAQTISDLENALETLPADFVRTEKWQVNKEVILGLLSRASLYSRDWEKAKEYSDDLLALNNYLMSETEYKSGFNDIANGEWIWGHPQKLDQNDASYQFHYLDVTSTESYYYSMNTDPYFRDNFNDGDYRKGMIYWAPDPGKNPASEEFVWMRYAKFKFKKDLIADIVLMRVSEIYLINAEAKARLNDGTAASKLNELKSSRGAQTVSSSGDALIKDIWLERRKELFGEGFNLVDLIRNQQSVERKDYPQTPEIELTYVDKNGKEQKRKYKPRGHRTLVFPNKTDFVANSKYYLFRIPDTEERSNKELYSKYPKLDIYLEKK